MRGLGKRVANFAVNRMDFKFKNVINNYFIKK